MRQSDKQFEMRLNCVHVSLTGVRSFQNRYAEVESFLANKLQVDGFDFEFNFRNNCVVGMTHF